jgi:hypothetical protein
MRKTFNAGKELAARGLNKVVAVTAGMVVLTGEVLAAVPAEVTAALGDLKTDAMVVATAFLGAAIAIAAFMYMRRPAK